MLISKNGEITENTESELVKVISSSTNKIAKDCIVTIILNNLSDILLVEFERFSNTIWIYQKNGIAILFDLPKEDNEGFRCDFFNFTGKRSLYFCAGKEAGALPF